MNVSPIMKTVVGLQSIAILGEGMKFIPKKISIKTKVKPIKFVKPFTNILFGTALIKPTSELVNQL